MISRIASQIQILFFEKNDFGPGQLENQQVNSFLLPAFKQNRFRKFVSSALVLTLLRRFSYFGFLHGGIPEFQRSNLDLGGRTAFYVRLCLRSLLAAARKPPLSAGSARDRVCRISFANDRSLHSRTRNRQLSARKCI